MTPTFADDLAAARAAARADAAWMRWRSLSHAERQREAAACAECGDDTRELLGIPYGGRHGRRYCSGACRQRAYRRRRNAKALGRAAVTREEAA